MFHTDVMILRFDHSIINLTFKNIVAHTILYVSMHITPCVMCVQYIGGGGGEEECSVHWGGGGMFSTQWDTMSTSGDVMSTLGDVQYIGGYHDACGGTR